MKLGLEAPPGQDAGLQSEHVWEFEQLQAKIARLKKLYEHRRLR